MGDLEEERIWDIDESVRERFGAKPMYELSLFEDVEWRQWKSWLRTKICTYLRENNRIRAEFRGMSNGLARSNSVNYANGQNGGGGGAMAPRSNKQELHAFLQMCKLEKFQEALNDVGIEKPTDFADLGKDDLRELLRDVNMKGYQIAFLTRAVEQLKTQKYEQSEVAGPFEQLSLEQLKFLSKEQIAVEAAVFGEEDGDEEKEGHGTDTLPHDKCADTEEVEEAEEGQVTQEGVDDNSEPPHHAEQSQNDEEEAEECVIM